MAESSKTPSRDVVDLWKRSEELARLTPAPAFQKSDSLSTERSAVWVNMSQLSPSDRATLMSRLSQSWPFSTERRALNWPVQAGLLANCMTSAAICARINGDMVLLDPKMAFFDSVRQGPKAPFVMGIYASGVTYFLLHQLLLTPLLYREGDICPGCLVSRSVAISLATGIAVPMLATPYLSYYVLLNRPGYKYPAARNLLEIFTMSFVGSKAARPLLPYAVAFQFAVSAAGTYAAIWGRTRMFDTLDADVEMAKELVSRAQAKPSLKERVMDFLGKVPFIGAVVGGPPPEEERVPV